MNQDVQRRRYRNYVDPFVRYQTVRDITYSYSFGGRLYTGVVKAGFLIDGFSFPMPRWIRPAWDRFFFPLWIVHDWLYDVQTSQVDGVNVRVSKREIDNMFPPIIALILSMFKRTSFASRQTIFADNSWNERKTIVDNSTLYRPI